MILLLSAIEFCVEHTLYVETVFSCVHFVLIDAFSCVHFALIEILISEFSVGLKDEITF